MKRLNNRRGLVVNEVIVNPKVLGSKLSGDTKTQVILSICSSLDGQSYLVPVIGGSDKYPVKVTKVGSGHHGNKKVAILYCIND